MSSRARLDPRRRPTVVLTTAGVLALASAALALGYAAAPHAGRSVTAAPTVVKVTAGKPNELAFTLSRTSGIPAGTVIFRVTNRGALAHGFKLCTGTVTSSKANSCTGRATGAIRPGKTATLSVSLSRPGLYEYLSTTPAHAIRGMKGMIGITLPASAAAPSTASSSMGSTASQPTTTTTPGSTTTAASSPGAALWTTLGCSGCHNLGEVRGYGTLGPNLNTIHPVPFSGGPLTQSQIADLAAYVNGS